VSVKLRYYYSSFSEEYAVSIFRVEEFSGPDDGGSGFPRSVDTVADYSLLYPRGSWTLAPTVSVCYSDYKFFMPQVDLYPVKCRRKCCVNLQRACDVWFIDAAQHRMYIIYKRLRPPATKENSPPHCAVYNIIRFSKRPLRSSASLSHRS